MKKYGVLVVDDSAFMRRAIGQVIEQHEELYVVGIARNGKDAIEKVKRLQPAVVTLDIEMPEMDGLEALEIIMNECPVPVVMLTNASADTASPSITSIELGAVDFIVKEKLFNQASLETINSFWERIEVAIRANVKPKKPRSTAEALPVALKAHSKLTFSKHVELLVIGCSTGGPAALQEILPYFENGLPFPVVVVQHMPKGFTKPLADRFNSICHLPVKEAEDQEVLMPGNIYIAPAGLQTTIKKDGHGAIFDLTEDAAIDTLYHPSVDVTLLSATSIYKEKLLTVILTGMGQDGLLGCKQVKENKGKIIVEAESTCVVYGMPRVVYEAGLADKQAPITNIVSAIKSLI
ncbi:chemotaxis-specific protein-glutamate methyltransferase CheB [Alkalihalobacterium chitinilyticum]|uniref:Protein-glutamate methylesterase/protein-glutamine glutaminase n=1 Tax=Alkalihalobacterium chitinilyticum TaxID=2980103 RepID=A0ABT5VJA9_9BACI|nr:chemotaxis-specific protein-glutamate methyltransferase CheB [Alkalihalobacterium chitinilyticum]MDE5415541.1 chemotaxis-specific protein-glutamate methyltransferase CheB [Alkalihalobacterium chitinilyticum]